MQILKPEIKDRILNESLDLFYDKGFEKTSTRDIAKKVRISVSNLYKYFENKEAIFDEIVRAYYFNYKNQLNKFLSHEQEVSEENNGISMLANAIFGSIKDEHKIFVVLMNKSNETKYSEFKHEVISLLENHIKEGVNKHNEDEFLIKICARNFFFGIIEIADNYKNDDWAYKNIYMLAKYHIKGISVLYE